jgi:hypothetical protein
MTSAHDSLPDASSTRRTLHGPSWPAAQASHLQQQQQQHQQCVDHIVKSAQVSEAAPVVAYPAIERALQRRTAVVALQQKAADATAHSRDGTTNNTTFVFTTNSSKPSSRSQHAHADTWQETDVHAHTTGCCMPQQGARTEDQPQQLHAVLQFQAGPMQARKTTSSHQAVELQQEQYYAAAVHTAVRNTAACAMQATSSAALAAEMQLVRSWRQQRHAAACAIQAAVRSWLIRRNAQHCRKVRQLQLCKARHILTAWRSEVEHRRVVGALIVQQLEANSSRGCQLWQQVQLDWAGEGRHVCAAVYHRCRVQSAVLKAWALVMACGSNWGGGLKKELDANGAEAGFDV